MAQQIVTFTVHKPGPLLSLNDRGNDHGRGNANWRDAAFWWAKQNQLRCRDAIGPVEIWVEFGTSRPNQRRDPHNFIKTVKAICDGFTRAAVWEDDDAKHVHTVEPSFTNAIAADLLRITLTWQDAS